MKSKLYEVSCSDFNKIVTDSPSIAQIIKKCGLVYSGRNVDHVRKRIQENNIDISHIPSGRKHNLGRGITRVSKEKVLAEYCIENSKFKRGWLKNYLIKFEIIPHKCEMCGLGNLWNEKPISLQIDHKNGIHNDNRIENLRFLCPNCHSQTPTFAGRNCKKKVKIYNTCRLCGVNLSVKKSKHCIKCHSLTVRLVERPTKEVLEEQIKTKSFVSLGKEYNVSDNGVRKWCKYYGIIT